MKKTNYWILGAIALGMFLLWKKAQERIAETIAEAGADEETPTPVSFSGIKYA